MTLPDALQAGIDEVVGAGDRRELERAARALSDTLPRRRRSGRRARHARRARSPPTSRPARRRPSRRRPRSSARSGSRGRAGRRRSILDLGAGPGIAAWAASRPGPGSRPSRSSRRSPRWCAPARRSPRTGRRRCSRRDGRWPTWAAPPAQADLVLVSYVIGELEPATLARLRRPRLVARRRHARDRSSRERPQATSACSPFAPQSSPAGGSTLAPCPHDAPCPLPEGDWCHFATRLARSRTHRLAKGAERGFEDEKFAYAVLTRSPTSPPTPRA